MPANELLDIVNEKDVVIGRDTKENKFAKELISRNAAIFVKDSKNRFVIVKRAANKRVFPNKLDLSACGNVKAGESYEEAAKRELREELGIKSKPKLLRKIFNEHAEDGKKIKYFTGIFLANSDDDIRLNGELAHFEKLTIRQIEEKINTDSGAFVQFFLNDFEAVKELLAKL